MAMVTRQEIDDVEDRELIRKAGLRRIRLLQLFSIHHELELTNRLPAPSGPHSASTSNYQTADRPPRPANTAAPVIRHLGFQKYPQRCFHGRMV